MTADKVYRYMLTVPSGLEEVALDELREVAVHLDRVNVEPGGRFGQIFFTYRRSPLQLLDLHSASHLAGLICEMHRVTVGQPGLKSICERVERIDLAAVQSLARAQPGKVDTGAFVFSVTLQGRYRFSNAEVRHVVREILREKHGLREGRGSRLLRFHLQITGHRALLVLRLGAGNTGSRAVAYCLCRLLAMQSDARVLWARRDSDELSAIDELFRPRLLLGLLPEQRHGVKIQHGVVAIRGQLPLKAGLIDYVLGFVAGDPISELAELARILRFGGVAIMQVEHFDRYIGLMEEMDFPFVVLAVLGLQEQGWKCRLLILERLGEIDPELLQVGWDV